MKYLLVILGLLLISCADTTKKTTINSSARNSSGAVTDTLYHTTDGDTLQLQNVNLYNTPYTCVIASHPLTSQNISYKLGDTVHIHPRKSVKISTLHQKDTVATHTLDLAVLKQHYDVFYDKLSQKYPEHKILAFPEISKTRLDSVRQTGARGKHIYYTAYITSYNTSKKYALDVGINYVKPTSNDYLMSQLQASH